MQLTPSAQRRETATTIAMARTLATQRAAMRARATKAPPSALIDFRRVRDAYRDAFDLAEEVKDRVARYGDPDNAGLHLWAVRAKLDIVASYATIAHAFLANPPLALTGSLVAGDVLVAEKAHFSELVVQFDSMLLEAEIDDKTADALDETRVRLEESVALITKLLADRPPRLQEF